MSDLVKRMRNGTDWTNLEAAERIEALEAENARFKSERSYVIGANEGFVEAAKQAAEIADEWFHNSGHGSPGDEIRAALLDGEVSPQEPSEIQSHPAGPADLVCGHCGETLAGGTLPCPCGSTVAVVPAIAGAWAGRKDAIPRRIELVTFLRVCACCGRSIDGRPRNAIYCDDPVCARKRAADRVARHRGKVGLRKQLTKARPVIVGERRVCARCGRHIDDRYQNSIYCDDPICARARAKERIRAFRRRKNERWNKAEIMMKVRDI